MKRQQNSDGVEGRRRHEVDEQQAAADDRGEHHGREQYGNVVRGVKDREGHGAADQRAHQSPPVALARQCEARLEDDQHGEQDPEPLAR